MIGSPFELMEFLSEQDPSKRFELKERKARRSLTQNAYYWSMLSKLKDVLGIPTDELHLHMLRQWGASETFELNAEIPLDGYFKYYDVIDSYIGADGKEKVTAYIYKESHLMTTAEFTRLINGMREECEAQGIDVMTPEEIAKLRR